MREMGNNNGPSIPTNLRATEVLIKLRSLMLMNKIQLSKKKNKIRLLWRRNSTRRSRNNLRKKIKMTAGKLCKLRIQKRKRNNQNQTSKCIRQKDNKKQTKRMTVMISTTESTLPHSKLCRTNTRIRTKSLDLLSSKLRSRRTS